MKYKNGWTPNQLTGWIHSPVGRTRSHTDHMCTWPPPWRASPLWHEWQYPLQSPACRYCWPLCYEQREAVISSWVWMSAHWKEKVKKLMAGWQTAWQSILTISGLALMGTDYVGLCWSGSHAVVVATTDAQRTHQGRLVLSPEKNATECKWQLTIKV